MPLLHLFFSSPVSSPAFYRRTSYQWHEPGRHKPGWMEDEESEMAQKKTLLFLITFSSSLKGAHIYYYYYYYYYYYFNQSSTIRTVRCPAQSKYSSARRRKRELNSVLARSVRNPVCVRQRANTELSSLLSACT